MKNDIEEFLKESNAIEGVYDEDSLQQAIYAWSYLFTVKEITPGVVLKTHKILMLHQRLQPDERGYFRRCGVRIGGRMGQDYVEVPDSIRHWCMNVNDVIKNGKKESDVFKNKIVKDHHVEYERIHPFVDGNGRTGRMFLNWERINIGLPILVIKENKKNDYYKWFK